MGIIFSGEVKRISPPKDLILALAKANGLNTFVETGTFKGAVTKWAASKFSSVVSIEFSPEFHADARKQFASCPHVNLLCGNSEELLALDVYDPKNCVFWLDAHWCTGATCPPDNECPLLGELHAILRKTPVPIILMDDARMFTGPVPSPHKQSCWPSIFEIERCFPPHQFSLNILNDVIVAAPKSNEQLIVDYCASLKPVKCVSVPETYKSKNKFYLWLKKLKQSLT